MRGGFRLSPQYLPHTIGDKNSIGQKSIKQ